MDKTNQCALVEWFRYEGACKITTCKFNTQMLDSGCLCIGRRDTVGKRFLTDTELKYYKFDSTFTVNDVTQYRKKAMIRAKKLIAMYYYTQFILNNCKIMHYVLPESCQMLLEKFPFRLSKMNITPILLANMLIPNNFVTFKRKVNLDSEYMIWDMFLMTRKKWEIIFNDFKTTNKLEIVWP